MQYFERQKLFERLMSFILNALKKFLRHVKLAAPNHLLIRIHLLLDSNFLKGVTCFYVQKKMLKISHLQPADNLKSLFYSFVMCALQLHCQLNVVTKCQLIMALC